MSTTDPFMNQMLNDMGFNSEEKRELRRRVLKAAYELARTDDKRNDEIWEAQDGYGSPGYTPPQGWDWSGIRDSSYRAVVEMAEILGISPGDSQSGETRTGGDQ